MSHTDGPQALPRVSFSDRSHCPHCRNASRLHDGVFAFRDACCSAQCQAALDHISAGMRRRQGRLQPSLATSTFSSVEAGTLVEAGPQEGIEGAASEGAEDFSDAFEQLDDDVGQQQQPAPEATLTVRGVQPPCKQAKRARPEWGCGVLPTDFFLIFCYFFLQK